MLKQTGNLAHVTQLLFVKFLTLVAFISTYLSSNILHLLYLTAADLSRLQAGSASVLIIYLQYLLY